MWTQPRAPYVSHGVRTRVQNVKPKMAGFSWGQIACKLFTTLISTGSHFRAFWLHFFTFKHGDRESPEKIPLDAYFVVGELCAWFTQSNSSCKQVACDSFRQTLCSVNQPYINNSPTLTHLTFSLRHLTLLNNNILWIWNTVKQHTVNLMCLPWLVFLRHHLV
jgi:hypothetical protein